MLNKGTRVFALGGLEEIGKNTYIIETSKTIIIVDTGIKFASNDLLGFDSMIANFDYLKKNEHKIGAMIITHGHEDHIGAIPFYLRNLNVKKIIASNLSSQLIMKKCFEHKDIKMPELITYFDETKLKIKDVEIEFFSVCHSIPDSFGIYFNTPDGTILSTGDFRIDFATNSQQTDLNKIVEFGLRGVDLLLCESTSVEVEGFSDSEVKIIANIVDIIKNAKGRIFLSTFASNLSRIEQIIKFVKTINKKILLVGRSMEANVKISRKLGYLKMSDIDFISTKELANYQDNEIFVLLTGSQGEEQAALNNILNGKHARISFKPSDTVILSSNPIPGNFAQVEDMINKLYRVGMTVVENTPEKKIHASGHATRGELQLMLKSVNPKYLMPIHGEFKMLKTMKKNAHLVGFNEENVIIAKNGQVVELKKHVATLTDEIIDSEPIFINGNEMNKQAAKLLKIRQTLSKEGFVYVIVKYDSIKNIIYSVSFSTRGSFYAKDCNNLVSKINYSIKEEMIKYIKTNGFNQDELTEIVRKQGSDIIWKHKKKKPIINVCFVDINEINNMAKNEEFLVFKQNNTMDFSDDLIIDEDDLIEVERGL